MSVICRRGGVVSRMGEIVVMGMALPVNVVKEGRDIYCHSLIADKGIQRATCLHFDPDGNTLFVVFLSHEPSQLFSMGEPPVRGKFAAVNTEAKFPAVERTYAILPEK